MARQCIYDDDGNELFCYDDDVGLESLNTVGLDFPPPNNINMYSGLGNLADIEFNLGGTGGIFDAKGNINPGAALFLTDSLNSDIFEQFKKEFPQEAALLDDPEMKKLLRQQELTQSGQNAVANLGPQGDTGVPSISLDGDFFSKLSASDLLKYGLPALGSYLSYKSAKDAQKEAKGVSLGKNAPVTATRVSGKGVRYSAMGGLQSLAQGGKSSLPPRYLDGHTDGMADKVPAHIDNRRPAALSDGEFVVPADVVSHLGNGNSTAGAKRLYEMMDRIRAARTGTTKQGKQINPDKFLPR